jgi:hypothetical protein
MRKLLLLCTFTAATIFSALTSQVSAQIMCPQIDTSEAHLSHIRSTCQSDCEGLKAKGESQLIAGCKKSCSTTYDVCVSKYKEWDRKKAECRKPIVACWDACPKGGDNQKCKDKCSDKLGDKLGECAKRAMN